MLADEGKNTQVVIEVDNPLEIERVVKGRAGRMQLHEAVQRGDGQRLLACPVVCVGLVQLSLLSQDRAGGAALEFFEQGDGLVVGAPVEFVFRLLVDPVGTPFGGLVRGRR